MAWVCRVEAELQVEPCLAVVIPCFNEADHVMECVARVLAEPIVKEVLLVDDGSTDGTDQILKSVTDERVQVVHHLVNHGKGAALRTGFAHATAELLTTQDADLEQDPGDFHKLVRPILDDHADVVYGTRFPGGRRHEGQRFVHHWANQFLTRFSNLLTGLDLSDMETGYKVFRSEVLEGIQIEEDRFGVEPEITAKIALAGWRVQEVPVSYSPRTVAAGKKIGWTDGVRAVFCILKYSRRPKRGKVEFRTRLS